MELLTEQLKMNFANGVKFSMELVTNGNKEEIRATSNVMNAVGYHHVDAIMSKWPILDAKIARRHPLYGYLCKSKAGCLDGSRRKTSGGRGRMADSNFYASY